VLVTNLPIRVKDEAEVVDVSVRETDFDDPRVVGEVVAGVTGLVTRAALRLVEREAVAPR